MAEKFKSKSGFILASIGAAVGLGNALRFPGLCAKYGGGAFLIIYLGALILLGIPLLNAEIALGRKTGGGAPQCMRSLFAGGDKLGWAQSFNSMFTALIYAGLAAWILSEAVTVFPLCLSGASRGEASEYFFKNVLQAGGDGVIRGISPLICLCLAAVWVAVWLCLRGGAAAISSVARFTVFLPVALFCAIVARGLSFESSGEALAALFIPDFSALSSPDLWINALGQVFFSLSLAVGIMPAYGAYLPDKCAVLPNSLIIAAADAFVSVLASVALFTTLYGCGLQGEIGQSGIITAFSIYPAAIVGLFKSPVICGIVGCLFYFSLAMMAVQSGVSMLEAALAPLKEKFAFSRKKGAAVICIVLAAVSLFYATTAADVMVEIGDRFVNFYNVIILCAAECLAMGHTKTGKNLCEEINLYCKRLKMSRNFYGFSVGFLCPAILIALAVPQIAALSGGLSYPAWEQVAFGWGVSAVVAVSGVAVSAAERRVRKNRKEAYICR